MNTKRGSALISTLVTVFVLGILSFGLMASGLAGAHITGHRRDSQAAFELAEAGFQHAYRSIVENQGYAGQSNVPLGPGKFTVTVTPVGTTAVNVTSVGTVVGGEGILATRTVSGQITLASLGSLLGYAVVSKGPITFSGNANVTSSPQAGVGDVFSNSNVSMSGSVTINGRLSAAGTIKSSGNAHATGGEVQGAAAVTFPTVDTTAIQKLASSYGSTSGSVNVGSGMTSTLQGVINGNLTVSGNGKIVLNGPVYVTGNVVLSGHSYSGSGAIFAMGTITVSGNSSTSMPDTSQLALISLSSSKSAVTLSGGAYVGGLVFCPYGTVTISGGAHVNGGVATNNINFSGGSNVTRNTAQETPPGIGTPTVAYYNDQSGG